MTLTWRDLFIMTLRTPLEAAQFVLTWSLSRQEIYMAVIAGAALSTVLQETAVLLAPPNENTLMIEASPLVKFVISAGIVMLFSQVLTWCGRALGGQGQFEDILVLLAWMQFVGIALQAIGLVLVISLPPLGALYWVATVGLSLWILLSFIQAGHQLPGIGNAAAVLFITFVGLIVGLSLLLALLGGGALVGVNPNV